MNRKEFLESGCYSSYHYKVKKLLDQWKNINGINEQCAIHHRDDTEETRKYNEEHYELWGFNEDGSFEYGRYVVFMTVSDHFKHHLKDREFSDEYRINIGIAQRKRFEIKENHPMYGKNHSEETKMKISKANKGKLVGEKNPMYGIHRYGEANPLYGRKQSDETRQKMSVKVKRSMESTSFLYKVYKNNNGKLNWISFRKALSTGDITFSDYKITITIDKIRGLI